MKMFNRCPKTEVIIGKEGCLKSRLLFSGLSWYKSRSLSVGSALDR